VNLWGFTIRGVIAFNLSKNQKVILDMLTKDFLSVKDISTRRGITKRAVYKTITKLKEKGALISLQYNHFSRGSQLGGVLPLPPTSNKAGNFRYHSQQFKIDYLGLQPGKFPGVGSHIFIDGNRVIFYEKYLEIFADKELSLWGASPSEALRENVLYFSRIFHILQAKYGVYIIKEGKPNIRMTKGHLAKIDSPEADFIDSSNSRLRVFSDVDGKLSYLVDNSHGCIEFEATHPTNHTEDMVRAEKHFNDWKNNNPPTLSEIMVIIKSLSENMKAITDTWRPDDKDSKLDNYFG